MNANLLLAVIAGLLPAAMVWGSWHDPLAWLVGAVAWAVLWTAGALLLGTAHGLTDPFRDL